VFKAMGYFVVLGAILQPANAGTQCPATLSMPDLMRIADTSEKSSIELRGGDRWTVSANPIGSAEKFARTSDQQLLPIIIQTAFQPQNNKPNLECPYDIYSNGMTLGRIVLSRN